MAEGDFLIYNAFLEKLGAGDISLEATVDGGHVFHVILVSGYSPDIDNDEGYSDVSAYEYATGDGYTEGGETIASQTYTRDDANDMMVFDGSPAFWDALGPLSPATPSHAIVVDVSTSGSTLAACIEIGSTATNGLDYMVVWNASGIFNIKQETA